MDKGVLKHITLNHLVSGYTLNNGDLSTMTPLQYLVVNLISRIIFKWKIDNTPVVTL